MQKGSQGLFRTIIDNPEGTRDPRLLASVLILLCLWTVSLRSARPGRQAPSFIGYAAVHSVNGETEAQRQQHNQCHW